MWPLNTVDLLKDIQFIRYFLWHTTIMWPLNTGDCLKEVTSWADLTVLKQFNKTENICLSLLFVNKPFDMKMNFRLLNVVIVKITILFWYLTIFQSTQHLHFLNFFHFLLLWLSYTEHFFIRDMIAPAHGMRPYLSRGECCTHEEVRYTYHINI
jgi:hypothetical protein